MTGQVHHVDTTAKLVTMINQIVRNTAREKDQIAAIADHIHAFWTVRMQQQLLEHGSTGLDPVAVAVMARLAPGIRAPHDA
ncbi:formate dehydrogenase subunit delta [Novosphingobium acidiphilum]|uniref:formate dehydrogenase subunit delta n=1 Tax=Novosphingobium acidiphilum TaxID=505248 RepID=UPI00041741FA|nr:formate dehydrogenase subunit delta [Novosphingobium acidiphilum]